eukprot:2478404-Prymnesium_polylepis.1
MLAKKTDRPCALCGENVRIYYLVAQGGVAHKQRTVTLFVHVGLTLVHGKSWVFGPDSIHLR